jgi:hypothetical protein
MDAMLLTDLQGQTLSVLNSDPNEECTRRLFEHLRTDFGTSIWLQGIAVN